MRRENVSPDLTVGIVYRRLAVNSLIVNPDAATLGFTVHPFTANRQYISVALTVNL
jgi:hypothetical protein